MNLKLFGHEQEVTTTDDYLTPRWVFDELGVEFDLDVAASAFGDYVPARRRFTKHDDGLSQPWEGFVWMNPPFSQASPWVRRFIDHGNGVCLVPWAKSAWTFELWDVADVVALPPNTWFDFDRVGQPSRIWMPVYFAAVGTAGSAALRDSGWRCR